MSVAHPTAARRDRRLGRPGYGNGRTSIAPPRVPRRDGSMGLYAASARGGHRSRSAGTASSAFIQAEGRQLQWMLRIGLVFFWVHAALSRLLWWRRANGERRTIAAEARDATDTYIPLAFAGW